MKGYNCTKTAMSQQRNLRKKNVQIPTPPSPRPFNTLQSSLAVPVRIGSKDKERVWQRVVIGREGHGGQE